MARKFSKDFYHDGRLSDISLKIGHERTLRVHRAVLASFSPYFEALLGDNWEEGKKDEMEILGLDESAVRDLMEFAYSGNINISKDNVQALLEAANYLGVESVKKSCEDFLKGGVDDKTCLGILKIADRFALEGLSKSAKQHALRHFSDVCKDKEFLSLPLNLVADLLADEELCVVIEDLVLQVKKREKPVLQAVFQYIEHDVENRREHLPQLLSLVRLPTLSESFLKKIAKHELVVGCCEGILEKAQKLKMDPAEKDTPDEKWVAPREFGRLVVTWGTSFACVDRITIPELWDGEEDISIFEDLENNIYVTGMAITIRKWEGGSVIESLGVFYNDDSPINSPKWIGDFSDSEFYERNSRSREYTTESHGFDLEENERIVEVKVNSGWMVYQLTFYTNKKDDDGNPKSYGPYGGDGGDPHGSVDWDCPAGDYGFLAGVAGTYIDSEEDAGVTRLQFAWRSYVFPGDPVPTKNECLCARHADYYHVYEEPWF